MGKAQTIRAGVTVMNAMLRVAFAPPCAACASPLELPLDGCVCPRCWATIDPPPHVPWPGGRITAAAAGGDYAGTLRQIVHAFKYDGRRSLAAPLGALMRRHGRDVLENATCLVPVPLHPWRRVRRGFNQATDLARTLDVPVVPILWRHRLTAAQASLNAAERLCNVRGAFELSPFVSRHQRVALRGAIVVLIDDVRTTGATLQASAEALDGLGVSEIRALTAAVRAPGAGGL
jgi:ComF family protein